MKFEDNTRTRNHYIGDLNYHIIFSTKFRRKCLSNIENELYDAFRYCESKSHFKIKTMKQDKDHIHLLVNIKPTYSLGQTINRMKQMTTNYLYRNEKSRLWLRNFYKKLNQEKFYIFSVKYELVLILDLNIIYYF